MHSKAQETAPIVNHRMIQWCSIRSCMPYDQKIQENPMTKKRNQLIGTPEADYLTGINHKKFIYGRGGDDIITSKEGIFRVWGESGRDLFVTLSDVKGHMEIMDLEVGETIAFCGCPSTRIDQRGKDAWILKGDDVKAVVKDTSTAELKMDFAARLITLIADPLA